MSLTTINTDQELLVLLKTGDEHAFEKLYRLYSPSLYYNILRMVFDEDAADDLLQDLFLLIWNKREQIDPGQSFKGYLLVCSKHLVLRHLRRINIEKQIERYLAFDQAELYQHVEEDLHYKETHALVQQAISDLPPQRKKVYRLCKLEGKSYDEAASLLGVSAGTVHDHMIKAKRFIKDQLLKSGTVIISGLIAFLLNR